MASIRFFLDIYRPRIDGSCSLKIAITHVAFPGGLKEVLQHDLSDKAHIQSIAAIPAIIENSIYIETRGNIDPEKNPDVTGYEHYVCGLSIAGEDYTVHSIVAADKAGNRYYDHKLSHIEKGRLLDFIEAKQPIERILTPMSGTEPTIRSERKVKELISLLQIEAEEAAMRFRDPGMGLEETIARMTDAIGSGFEPRLPLR